MKTNKKPNKKTTRKNVKVRETTAEYSTVDNKFKTIVNLGSGVEQEIEFTLDKEDLHYDDLIDEACELMEEKYPEEDFPNAKVEGFEIFSNDIEDWCPVFAEEEDKDKIEEYRKNGHTTRFLVLPEYHYVLTEESKLWLSMIKNGLVSEDDEFDYKKMHNILEGMKK